MSDGVMSARARLRALERAARGGGGAACPLCGAIPGTPVVFRIDTAPATGPHLPAQRCARCGATTRSFTIRIDRRADDGDEDGDEDGPEEAESDG